MSRLRANAREPMIRGTWMLIDVGCWGVAVIAAVWIRYAYDPSLTLTLDTAMVALAAATCHLVLGILFGPYLVTHVRGSFEEVTDTARAASLTAGALLVWAMFIDPVVVPRSVPLVAGAVALSLMLASRFVVRSYRAHSAALRKSEANVLVFGAGLVGRRLVQNLLHDDQSPFRPVAFVDDDRGKRKLRIEGVPVRGDRTAIPRIAERYDATHLAVAVPRADAAMLREVKELAEEAGLTLKVLPSLDQMLDRNPRATDLRDINLEDLLGRRAVQLDQGAIADQVTGKVVLVTGAGGSIGSELCRQIARFQPARLLLLERDESALHATQLSLTGRGLLEGEDLLLADIRDAETVHQLFTEHKPDLVFHTAALKHLSLLERYPHEAWQTNVLGTLNVLRAAADAGVGTFVNISTDKAASPTSVLGYTKRIAERLTADFAGHQPGRYVSVRFGNVLGSRGSVIPAFTEQIRRGGPVTITHPDVERYFMLIPEACQLVLQASAIGTDGEVMVLDMGTPVKIAKVAETLIEMSGRHDIDVVYTGLRPGEKMSEVLFTGGDDGRPSAHPMLSAVAVPTLCPTEVRAVSTHEDRALVSWLTRHIGEHAASV